MESKNFRLCRVSFPSSLCYTSLKSEIFLKNSVAFFRQETLYYIKGGI